MLWHGRYVPLVRFLTGFFFQTFPIATLTPLLTLSLAEQGVEARIIGSLVTAGSLAYMLALAAAPRLIRRYGQTHVFRRGLFFGAVAVLGLTITTEPAVLIGCFALAGFTAGLRYTLAESWVPALVGPEVRGRAMALFQTIVGAAWFTGSASLLFTGIHGIAPRLAVLTTEIIALALLWSTRAPDSSIAPTTMAAGTGLRGTLMQVGPLVLGIALLGGLFESGLSIALPLFSLEVGFGATLAAGVVTAIGLGSLAQYPLGALVDRWPWHSVTRGVAAVIAASALLLPLTHWAPWLLLVLGLIWGSAGGGLYTLAIIRNSSRLRGERLISASAVTQFAYMIGDAAGPTLGGLALDLSPRFGLPLIVIGASLVGLALITLIREPAPHPRPAPIENSDPSPRFAP